MSATLDIDDRVFRAVPLEPGTARQAFVLAQVFDRRLVLGQWSAYTRAFRSGARTGRGLMSIVDRRGYVHAFFAWRVQTTLARGRVLEVEEMIVGHLPGTSLPEAIAHSLRELANTTACRSMVLDLPCGTLDPATRALFVEQGFAALPQERQVLVAHVPDVDCLDAG